MARILVHLTHGPEHPTRAALAFLVARSAVEEGHEVSMFLAGDAVQLMRPAVMEHLRGLGTGELGEHQRALREAGVNFYLSGASSKSRGLTVDGAEGEVEMASPVTLVRLALEHDRMFNY